MMKNYSLLTGIAAGIFLLFSGCNERQNAATRNNKVMVKTEKIEAFSYFEEIHASGILFTKTETKLSFKTGGIIDRIYVDEGNYVKKGTAIASLKLTEINARVEQAQLAYDKAIRDFSRIQNLYSDSVATLEQFQDMKTAVEISKANLNIARFNLQHSQLIAPGNGKILRKLAQDNEMISQGYPVVIFGATESDWVVRVSLVDKDLVQVNAGDSASISFDAFPEKVFKGIISEIGSMADPFTGTYEVEVKITDPSPKFASGLVGIADIKTSNEQQLLRVPLVSMIEGNENTGYVYLLEQDKPIKQKVNIHHFDQEYLYINNRELIGRNVITVGVSYINRNSEISLLKD